MYLVSNIRRRGIVKSSRGGDGWIKFLDSAGSGDTARFSAGDVIDGSVLEVGDLVMFTEGIGPNGNIHACDIDGRRQC